MLGSHVLSRPDFWMVWRCHGILCVSFILFFCCCSEATLESYFIRALLDISLVIIHFFSHTNQIFKSNSEFTDILDRFCHSLFTFLSFDLYLHLTNFKVIQCPYAFLMKSSKVLMRSNVPFSRFSSAKCNFLFSMKNSYLLKWNCC